MFGFIDYKGKYEELRLDFHKLKDHRSDLMDEVSSLKNKNNNLDKELNEIKIEMEGGMPTKFSNILKSLGIYYELENQEDLINFLIGKEKEIKLKEELIRENKQFLKDIIVQRQFINNEDNENYFNTSRV